MKSSLSIGDPYVDRIFDTCSGHILTMVSPVRGTSRAQVCSHPCSYPGCSKHPRSRILPHALSLSVQHNRPVGGAARLSMQRGADARFSVVHAARLGSWPRGRERCDEGSKDVMALPPTLPQHSACACLLVLYVLCGCWRSSHEHLRGCIRRDCCVRCGRYGLNFLVLGNTNSSACAAMARWHCIWQSIKASIWPLAAAALSLKPS